MPVDFFITHAAFTSLRHSDAICFIERQHLHARRARNLKSI